LSIGDRRARRGQAHHRPAWRTGRDTDSLMAELGASLDKHVEQEKPSCSPWCAKAPWTSTRPARVRRATNQLLFELSAARKEPPEGDARHADFAGRRARAVRPGLRNVHAPPSKAARCAEPGDARRELSGLEGQAAVHLREKDAQLKRVETILGSWASRRR